MKHVLNSKNELVTNVVDTGGQRVVLNSREAYLALMNQKKYDSEVRNALGFEIPITTLYAISKSIVEQKFATLDVPDYLPLRVGDNAWSENILTYRSFQVAGEFSDGYINTGSNNSKLATADAGVDSLTNKVITWANDITWSFPELKFAARSGNWDVVSEKERSRKRRWDLGIQKIAFLGDTSAGAVYGLLNQPNVNANTTLIQAYIHTMDATDFSALVQSLLGDYRSNCNFTAWPTHFVIPELDYNGLATLTPGTAGTFPIPMIEYLRQMFATITQNPNFKIKPCFYGDQVNNGLSKNVYALYNSDQDSLRMDIPVDYGNTLQNTINGFQFTNVGYGQFTGALAYRPAEMLYYTFAN